MIAAQLTDAATASIKNASSVVAKDMLSYYHGSDPGQFIGVFGEPYDWGESGAVWGSLIDYWNYTGDTQYVALVQQALLWQVGPDPGLHDAQSVEDRGSASSDLQNTR